ncbi:MAG: DUF4376 domain-containing protein [Fusobacteriaceae bacterium]
MNIYVYEKDRPVIGFPAPSMEEFMEEPEKYYPAVKAGFIASLTKIDNYIIKEGIVKEKTREDEILLEGKLELLYPGEIMKDGKIEKIEIPGGLYKPLWKSPIWIEGATLEECKEFKRIEMKGIRDKNNEEEIEYDSDLFDGDSNSKNKLFQASQIFKGTENEIDWITVDNQIAKIRGKDLENIVGLFSTREQELFTKFADRLVQIESCKDIESIKKIKWEA